MTHRLASACWPSWLSRGGRRSRLLPVEDLPPPIGIGGGDPSTPFEAQACRDAALHWPSRHAMQTAVGTADCVSPGFAQYPGDPPPSHRHGSTLEVGCAAGTSQAASTSSAAMAPDEPRPGRGSWRWSAPLLHRSHRGSRRPPNDGPWSVPPCYSQDGRGQLGRIGWTMA